MKALQSLAVRVTVVNWAEPGIAWGLGLWAFYGCLLVGVGRPVLIAAGLLPRWGFQTMKWVSTRKHSPLSPVVDKE